MPMPAPIAAPPTRSTTADATLWRAEYRLAGDSSCQEQIHEGRGDAVVEAALDVNEATDLAGTRSSLMTEAPRAASVGATMAPTRAATHKPLAPEEQCRGGSAGGNGEWQTDARATASAAPAEDRS